MKSSFRWPRLDLPVIVHEREAHGDAMDILRAHPRATGVFHCFSGSPEMALWLVERGWYIGFTGVVTFKTPAAPSRPCRPCRLTAS